MSSSTNIAPGKALISIASNDIGGRYYQYTLSDGSTGEIPVAVFELLEIDNSSLPALIDTELLIRSIGVNNVKLTDLVTQIATKADVDFVKKLSQQKLNITKFTDFIHKAATVDLVEELLAGKADVENTQAALDSKVDKNSVYTIDEFHRVLFQFIGAKGVRTIRERDALEYAVNPFVWVLDASGDPSPSVQSPAFYKWNGTHWVYIGTIGHFVSGDGGSVDLGNYYTIQEINRILGDLVPSINSSEDIGKVITVGLETVDGNPVYKYVLADPKEFDPSVLENAITVVRETVDGHSSVLRSHSDTLVSHETRIETLENSSGSGDVDLTPITNRLTAAENRLTTVEETLGHVNTEVSNILNEEFDSEV